MSRATLTITKNELKAFLDRPAGYVLLAVFALVVDFLFFRSAYASGEASLRPLFTMLPWIFLIFVPAVTMRLLAEEERGGTIEILLTEPISEVDVLLGKSLGGTGIVAMALATTIPVPLGLSVAGRLDWGVVASQYIAALLLGMALVAVGLFASSLTRNQVMASIAAAAIGFALMLLGFEVFTLALPSSVAAISTSLSPLSRGETIARGVLDLRDVLYFASVVMLFGLGAYLVLHGKRANRRAHSWYNLEIGAVFIAGIVVATNLLVAPFSLRLDLTASHLYTLSPTTVSIVKAEPNQVTLTLFASRNLPPQVATTYRDVKDVLTDLAQASGGRVQLVQRFPDVDQAAAQQANALGIQPVQFNVVKQEQFSVTQGWLGIALQSGANKEAIPFVQTTSDLEYQLASLLKKLQGGSRRTIAFTTGHGEKTSSVTGALRGELQKTYAVIDIPAGGKKGLGLAGVRVLIVDGPQRPFTAQEKASITRFIDQGGAAFFMLQSYTVNAQYMLALPSATGLGSFPGRWGAVVGNALMYDLRSNEPVSFTAGGRQVTVPYPFWLRLKTVAPNVIGDLGSALLPWPSPVAAPTTDTPPGAEVTPLLVTSRYAGTLSGPAQISPDRKFTQSETGSLKTLFGGAAVLGPPAKARWRIAVIGDSDFAGDSYAGNAPENIVLALNTIDWLAQDEALAAIRTKSAAPRSLTFSSAGQQFAVTWANQLGVPLLIAAFGAWHLWRRRMRARKGDAR